MWGRMVSCSRLLIGQFKTADFQSAAGYQPAPHIQLLVGINEFPTRFLAGIKPTVNRFGGPGGPLFELDNRFSRDLRSLFRNRQKSCDQAFESSA